MDSAACNAEHIIPLSLGGSNSFTVPVSKALNAELGSAIDAALATSDVLTMFRRREFDARGHSNKKPEVRIRDATYGADLCPAQVTLGGRVALRYGTPETGLSSPSKSSLGRTSDSNSLSSHLIEFVLWRRSLLQRDIRFMVNCSEPSLTMLTCEGWYMRNHTMQ